MLSADRPDAVAARTARDAALTKAREALMTNDEIATKCLPALMPAQARLDTTSAVDAYNQVKDGLTEMPFDMSQKLAYVLSRAVIAKAREHVDALEALLEDFGRLSPADRCTLGGVVDEATEVLELLEERHNFLCKVEVVEEALSSLDAAQRVGEPRRCARRSVGSKRLRGGGHRPRIATAFRYHGHDNRRYDRERRGGEAPRRARGLQATDGSGSAYDEKKERGRVGGLCQDSHWKAAHRL